MSWFVQQALAGNNFVGSSLVAGVDLPISTTLSPTFALWNPVGSGVNLVLNTLMLDAIDVTTPLLTAAVLSFVANTGGNAATGAPVAAFTNTLPFPAAVGGSKASKARFGLAATLTAAGAVFYALGYNRESATVAVGNQVFQHNFNGAVVVPQGTLIHLCGVAAFTTNIIPTLTWSEVAA